MVDDREDKVALETRDGLANVGFLAQKLGRVSLPGVVFSMRYPDDAGYVWNTIAQGKDEAALHLRQMQIALSLTPDYLGTRPTSLKTSNLSIWIAMTCLQVESRH